MGIAPLAIEAEAGIRAAGGMPQLFRTITISDEFRWVPKE